MHIASISFGKDSLATILLALKHSEPLDEAVYCEVMFDEKISGEIPEHIEFINDIAIPKLQGWGVKVMALRSEKTYVSNFTTPISRGEKAGKIRSFPLCGRCNIQRDCKLPPLHAYKKSLPGTAIQYIGIANDEQERLLRLDGVERISLLDKYGISENGAFEMCRHEGLLSPIYGFTNRSGCFFCPNAKKKELRHLYDYHQDLWQKMLALQALPDKATELFNRSMTFAEIDENFRAEGVRS